tara:strand:+ start:718 stop:1644 length:927 start_codon:yes stop_codon:yes gene_type:complete
MILVGLLCAIILGAISFFIRNNIFAYNVKSNLEKQIVIIDVSYKNKISDYISKLNEIDYLDKNLSFSNELYTSLEYLKIRYRNTYNLGPGCYRFGMNLTDNSIFITTIIYPSKDKKIMDKCLQNLFNLSFNRLKQKLEKYNYQQIALSNFRTKQDDLDEVMPSAKTQKEIEICKKLDELKDMNFSNEGKNNLNENYKTEENFLSVFTLYNNIMLERTLYQICENISFNPLKMELKKKKFLFHMKNLSELVEKTKFEEIFKVEKLIIPIKEAHTEYLSTKNIVITFSLFGFIFGVLLVYNFRSFKDENE